MVNFKIEDYGNTYICKAKEEHIKQIAPYMRKIDLLEVACMGVSPEESMLNSLRNDDYTFTVCNKEDVPFAMFGVGDASYCPYIWFLSTDEIYTHRKQFLKVTKTWLSRFNEIYPVVCNFVHKDNEFAIRWLKWCGAKFINKRTFKEEEFIEFIITGK